VHYSRHLTVFWHDMQRNLLG